MTTSPQPDANAPRDAAPNNPKAGLHAERAYRSLTVAFMLLLLGSLWLFR